MKLYNIVGGFPLGSPAKRTKRARVSKPFQGEYLCPSTTLSTVEGLSEYGSVAYHSGTDPCMQLLVLGVGLIVQYVRSCSYGF